MNSRHAPLLALAVLLTAFACLLLPSPAHAQPSPPFAGAAKSNANLRGGPGTSYARIGGVSIGQPLQVVACNTGCTWYKLDSGAWIAASLVTASTTAPPATAPAPAATDAAPAAQPSTGQATAKSVANLRSGPGTRYARVGSTQAGQTLNITGRNDAGDWYQLSDGTWIAAFLVDAAPAGLPVVGALATPTEATPTDQPPAPTPTSQGSAEIVIDYVNYDGAVYRVESDEYVQIANKGSAPANIGGWMINAGDPGQNFSFPSLELAPGQSVRVYTNESHPETGGYSFGRGQAIWNNKGDCGVLYDAGGNEVDSYCY